MSKHHQSKSCHRSCSFLKGCSIISIQSIDLTTFPHRSSSWCFPISRVFVPPNDKPVPPSPRPHVPTSPRPPVPPFPWQAQLTLLVAVHVFALQPLGELRGKADVVGRGEVEKELLGVVRDVEGTDEGLHPFLV